MSLDTLVSGLIGPGSSSTPIINQDRTILGPLTTTFTAPATCTVAAVDGTGDDLQGFLAKTCSGLQGPSDDSSCWPGTTTGAPAPSASFAGWGFYSPGIVCPSGYATACSATGGTGGTSDWDIQFQLLAAETAVGCCPSGYACGNNGGQTCFQVMSTASVSTQSCSQSDQSTTSGLLDNLLDVSVGAASITVFAPLIQINWKSTDVPTSTTTAAQTLASSSQPAETNPPTAALSGTQTISADSSATGDLEMAPSTSNGIVGQDPTPVAIATSDTNSSDETTGNTTTNEQSKSTNSGSSGFPVPAVIGISVAGGIGALAVGIWACYMYQRRRRHRKDMIQGIGHDRMLQQLDNMYEATRPKLYEFEGNEGAYGPNRHIPNAYFNGTRMNKDLMYGPGQETDQFFREGPKQSTPPMGHSVGMTSRDGLNSDKVYELGGDLAHDQYHRR